MFSCIRASANTGPACIRTEVPQEIFPACIGFVPGGTPVNLEKGDNNPPEKLGKIGKSTGQTSCNRYPPKGVLPQRCFRRRILDAFLTNFGAFLFTHSRQDPFWRIFDAFLMHSCYCQHLFREHLLDGTDVSCGPGIPPNPKNKSSRRRVFCEEVLHGVFWPSQCWRELHGRGTTVHMV